MHFIDHIVFVETFVDELFMKNGLFEKLTFHQQDYEVFDANIKHDPLDDDEKPYKEFVGNGYIGITLDFDSPIYVKHERSMSIPIYWHPVIKLNIEAQSQLATVVDYKNGMAYRYECFANKLQSSIKYFAYRALPSILVQDIELMNPTDFILFVKLNQPSYKTDSWSKYNTRVVRYVLSIDNFSRRRKKMYLLITSRYRLVDQTGNYIVASGISMSVSENPIYAVAITYTQCPSSVKVKRLIICLHFITKIII